MIVRKQSIRFDGNRVPVPRSVRVGYEGDHLVERLIFEVPRIGEEQSVFLVTDGEYADVAQLEQDADGRYAVDLTAEMLGEGGAVDCWVQVRGADGAVWNSGVLRMRVGELPDADGDLIDREPTIVEQVTQAAQQAEDAAQRAEDAAQEAQNAMKDAARLDDNTVSSESTWSSAALIGRLCPEFSESGAVVSCHPVAGSMLGVVSGIEAVQEGSGDPSPDNVRAISGHEHVVLKQTGKNLLPFPYAEGGEGAVVQRNGIAYTVLADRGIRIEGTAVAGAYFVLQRGNDYGNTAMDAMASPTGHSNGKYAVSHRMYYNGISKVVSLNVASGTTVNEVVYPQIEVGTVSTAYEPYRSDVHTVQFPETVYGGTYDWERGVLTVTHRMVTITPEIVWSRAYGGYVSLPDKNPATASNASDLLADRLKITNFNSVYAKQETFAIAETIDVPGIAFRVNAETDNNQEAIREWIAENPVTIVYRLAEPYEVQLTGAVITATDGENVLMSSTGETTVKGRSDPVWVIGTLAARIAALEAAAVNGN